MPDGKTIAHGLLVLSFAPKLKDDAYADPDPAARG